MKVILILSFILLSAATYADRIVISEVPNTYLGKYKRTAATLEDGSIDTHLAKDIRRWESRCIGSGSDEFCSLDDVYTRVFYKKISTPVPELMKLKTSNKNIKHLVFKRGQETILCEVHRRKRRLLGRYLKVERTGRCETSVEEIIKDGLPYLRTVLKLN